MKKFKIFVVFLILSYSALGMSQRTSLDDPVFIKMLRLFKEINLEALVQNSADDSSAPNARSFEAAVQKNRVQKKIPEDSPFPCNVTGGRSSTVPTSVHRLRPGDIDIIGALGDSLTAGSGIFATNLPQVVVENRGASAFGGGQYSWREILTLPNILKEFNPQLFGYAVEDSFTHQPESRFNLGENLAMSRDLPFMARNLILRMKNNPRVDVKNHWKLINILIGANDFCSDICYESSAWTVLINHRNDLLEALRLLRDNLPRTIVSLIAVPSIRELMKVQNRPLACDFIAHMACSCFIGQKFAHKREESFEIIRKWQELDAEIAASPEFKRQDFAVLFQTFSNNLTVPLKKNGKTDFRYLSADCFHPSQRFHAKAALGLWANLLQLPDEKKRTPDYSDFPCPTEERPYLATWRN